MELIQKLETMKSIVERLSKWERGQSMTMVNREAHYQALAAVKDHVLKYVTDLVAGMKPEDIKEVTIAGRTLTIRKHMNDMYSGKVVAGTDIIHQFDRTTIPQIAGQLQSLLELYDPKSLPESENRNPTALLLEKLKPFAEEAKDGMVSQLISIMSGGVKEEKRQTTDQEIESIIREAQEISDEARRNAGSPDPRKEIEELKDRVNQMLHRVESVVSRLAPTSAETDKLHDTLHQMQVKHDYLVDRAQQELNILEDRVAEITRRLDGLGAPAGKTITITIG